MSQHDPVLTEADEAVLQNFVSSLADMCDLQHKLNARWWMDPASGERIQRNIGEMLMLVVTEIAEAMEGWRKNLPDDKLPHHPMLTVELADAIIRMLDLAGGLRLNLAQALLDKTLYNLTRADHTLAARLAPGGKRV